MGNTQVLTGALFQNVNELINASQSVGVPLWIATAFVEAESHGQNIYGHDAGGTFSGHGMVTQNNYAEFYDRVVVHHGRSNGVGPMQITWSGFLVDAANRGIPLWDPLSNFEYGLRLIAGYLSGNYSSVSIAAAGRRYNGSAQYGVNVASRAAVWHGRLVDVVAPSADILRVGSKGSAVSNLQSGLNRVFPAYSHLVVDGDFGPATERVVVEAQTRFGVQADGVVGPVTRGKLASVGITF